MKPTSLNQAYFTLIETFFTQFFNFSHNNLKLSFFVFPLKLFNFSSIKLRQVLHCLAKKIESNTARLFTIDFYIPLLSE